MARYEVDLYQLNLSKGSVGDSAVALLVLKNPTVDAATSPPSIGSIVSAVLIDGGNSYDAAQTIRDTFTEIERTYTITSNDKRLKLDAVVVTHWDADHMNGVNQLFSSGNFKPDWDQTTTPKCNVHLKYIAVVTKNKDNTTTTTYSPLTKLYSQSNWPVCKKPQMGRRPNSNPKFTITDQFLPLYTLNASQNDLLGVNIFAGTTLTTPLNWKTITTPKLLITNNDPWFGGTWGTNGGAPGLYIVGVNGQLLGDTIEMTADGFATDDVESIGPPVGMPAVIDQMNVTQTNPNSVVMLLIWKNKDPSQNPKVSLYTGGDAEYVMEDKVATFMQGDKIQVYKGGHHGSKAGTSATFIKAVKPDHIIYSAGKEHGHPVPECILYLDSWLTGNAAYEADGSIIAKRLHGICYPYQLGLVQTVNQWEGVARPIKNWLTDPDTLSTNYTGDVDYQRFIQWLLVQYANNDPDEVPDPIKRYSQFLVNYTRDNLPPPLTKPKTKANTQAWQDYTATKARYLTPILTEMWDRWSKTTYDMYPASAWDTSARPDSLTIIDYIYVTFAYNQGTPDRLQSKVTLCKMGSLKDVTPKALTISKTQRLDMSDLDSYVSDDGYIMNVQDASSGGVVVSNAKIAVANQPKAPPVVAEAVANDDTNGNDGGQQKDPNPPNPTPKRPSTASASLYLSFQDEAHVLKYQSPVDTENNDVDPGVPMRTYLVVKRTTQSTAQSVTSNAAPATITAKAAIVPAPNKIRCSIGPTGADTINLASGSNADMFLTGLKGRCLTLTGVQAAGTATYVGTLAVSDFLGQWLSAFFSDHTALATNPLAILDSASVTIAQGTPQSSFSMRLAVKWPTSSPNNIQFVNDAATVKSAVNLSSDVSALMDATGFLVLHTGIVLGLDTGAPNSTISMTLQELSSFIQVELPPFLGADITLTLDSGIDTAVNAINAIWMCPNDSQSVTWRMTLTGDTPSAFLVTKIPGLEFTNSRIIATKSAYLTSTYDGSSAGTQMNVFGDLCIKTTTSFIGTGASATLGALACDTYFELTPDTASLIIRFAGGADQMTDLLAWMAFGGNDGPGIDVQSTWESFSSMHSKFTFSLRELYISANYDSVNEKWSFYTFRVTFEIDLGWGAAPGYTIPVKVTFTYRGGNNSSFEFNGRLWDFVDGNMLRLMPDSKPYPLMMPSSLPTNTQYYFSIYSLLSPAQKAAFPTNAAPTAVTGLSLTIGTENIAFFGGLQQDTTLPAPANPSWISLDSVFINATYDFTTITFELFATILLYPRMDPPPYVAKLDVDISYDGTVWNFFGEVVDLNCACLASLFPNTDSDAIMNVLEQITILDFQVDLATAPTASESKSFTAWGIMQLGDVVLTLSFARNTAATGQGNWTFSASVEDDFEFDSTTIGSFLTGINPDVAAMLPDIISNISFGIPAGSSITLNVTKETSGILFSLVVDVGDFEFAFAQISSAPQTDPTLVPTYVTPKRIFKFAMDKLPDISSVPLLDKLSQPFDQMDFFWCSDNLLRQEVDDLNAIVFTTRQTRLVFTDPITQTKDPAIVITPGTASPGDIVVQQGCHFQVVVEENNVPTPIVDYCFAGTVTQTTTTSAVMTAPSGVLGEDDAALMRPMVFPNDATTTVNDATTASASNSASGRWTKTIGPLTVSSVSLKLQNGYLYIGLDASIKLGPIAGNVKGFMIGIPLSSNLHSIDTDRDIDVLFTSIGIEMSRPPVELAGELKKATNGFEGGLVLEIEAYTFVAGGGYYDKVPDPVTGTTFKSMFVFAELDGPIAELELGSLSDLTGGVGYNSQITLPTIDNVTQFPFIATSTRTGTDPLGILNGYLDAKPPWFTPANGPAWFALGITASALSSLTVKSVAVLDLSEDVKFGIYADAMATFPAGVTDDAELFARVDMGLLAEIEPSKGIFHAEGQLTPKSFIMSQACKLTGGFALCFWFEGSGHSGDWVFSIGGYHPAYQKPLWYPSPVRLAINWQFNSEIFIHGEAYFAITPKVCMGGGKISLQYVSGSLQAYFDAWLDFLINYKPFSFSADVGITIKIHYTCNIFFISHTFDVDFGATASINGPPVAGVVHIHWHIISFDIHFGNASPPIAALDWLHFYDLVLQLPDGTAPVTTDQNTGQGMHTITPTAGVLTNTSNPTAMIQQDTKTEVLLVDKAKFSFSFTSAFPVTSITYTGGDQVSGTSQETDTLYIKPMQISTAVTSSLTVTITGEVSTADFTWQPIYKQVPTAVWGQYSTSTDPTSGPLSDSAMNSQLDPSNSTVLQCMGIEFNAPEPNAATDTLTFNIEAGIAYAGGLATMPAGPIPAIPATIGTTSAVLDAAMNVSAPITPSTPYAPRTILSRIQSPKIAKTDVLNAWIRWTGVDTTAPLGGALANLGAGSGVPQNWLGGLQNAPTQPLPVLTAEASVKSLLGDGTRFASWGAFRGSGPMLNRDWLDGGSTY